MLSLAALLSLLSAGAEPWSPSIDPWALAPPKLINRDLDGQLADQPGRLGLLSSWLTLAGDFSSGTQLPFNAPQVRFHGYFVLDAFAELRPLEGVELTFNLTALNYSASSGYRADTAVLPAGTLHLFTDVFLLDGDPLRIDFLAVDLDLVTLGEGLILEQIALEGEGLSLRWRDLELRHYFGGKVFWRDNLITAGLSAFDGALGAQVVTWFSDDYAPAAAQVADPFAVRFFSSFASLHARLRPLPELGLAGEYGARFTGGGPRSALLLRADLRGAWAWEHRAHLNYQFRYYQRGFGPRQALEDPVTLPQLPYREELPVTNSFEYFGLSHAFDQWSHTLALEAEGRPLWYLGYRLSLEYWLRFISAPAGSPAPVLSTRGTGQVPGIVPRAYYRAAVELYPWPALPHRISAILTNKLIDPPGGATDAAPQLFIERTLFALTVEAFL